jgi:hypothetical protein
MHLLPNPYRRVFQAVLCAVILLLLAELAAQVRSQLRFGQSVFNALSAQTMYETDPATGLLLLRPNMVFPGSEKVIRSNSLGLRSPEIKEPRVPGSLRIAVIGASTVMGAYAADNSKTFPAMMDARLKTLFPERKVEVINAGIVGYGLPEQRRMLTRRVAPLHPDLVIVYPGFNDFAGYCRKDKTKAEFVPQGLPMLQMPSWLLSSELLIKNTGALRELAVPQRGLVDASVLDIKTYVENLNRLIASGQRRGITMVLATNARSYRRDQPVEVQLQLSETARFYNDCFDLENLHVLYERHNAAIQAAAAQARVPVVDLQSLIPGGTRYFVDSSHFSETGENLAATALVDFLVQADLLKATSAP